MALALIVDVVDGSLGPVVSVDAGSNRFVRYSIGSESRTESGFDLLEGVSYESPLLERVSSGAFGTRIDVPIDPARLDRIHHLVQITTFREADGTGPAWSAIVPLSVPVAGETFGDDGLPGFRRPAMSRGAPAFAASMSRSVPMTVRESSMSAAMDWGALLGLVDDLAPLAQQVLEFAGDEKVQDGASGLVKILGPLFQQVMGGVGGLAGGILGGGAPAPVATSRRPVPSPTVPIPAGGGQGIQIVGVTPSGQRLVLLPATGRALSPSGVTAHPPQGAPCGAHRPPASSMAGAQAVDGGVFTIPAILGIVSAVAPTVMKVLTPLLEKSPEMFETYMDHPIKMLNAIGDQSRLDQREINDQVNSLLGQGNQQLLLTMLQGLGQGGGSNPLSPAALAGLAGLSGSSTIRAGTTIGSRNPNPPTVDERVDAVLAAPAAIAGVPSTRSLYAAGRPVGLRLSLTTPHAPPDRPIPHAVAHIRVSDAATAQLRLERRIELAAVYLNQQFDLLLDAAAVSTLPVGRDLNVSVDVTWTGVDGRVFTTPSRAVQHMSLVDTAFVAEPGHRTGTEVALTDPQRHRAFWHRIWEGGSASHSRWELNVAARYYYTLTTGEATNARMETKFLAVDETSKDTGTKVEWGGLLKSGMELSPDVLNSVLGEVGETAWGPGDLMALRSETVARSVATKAELDIHLRGRTEERGAVWVTPVLAIVELDLHRPKEVDDRGAVVATTVERRRFPLPVAAVVIGMENEG